jgi:hypothetical protein
VAFERQWSAVTQAFTSDGTVQGLVTVSDAKGFYVKQQIYLSSNTQPSIQLQVQRVIGPNWIYVSKPGTAYNGPYTDVSAYKVADNATISANQQLFPTVKPEDADQATFEREPIVARRVIPVDEYGTKIGKDNPLNVIIARTIPEKWDDIELTYDSNDNLIQASWYLNSILIRQLALSYDSNDNTTKVVVVV